MPIPEPEDFLGEIDMTESLADRMQLCKDRYNDIPQGLIDEARELEAENTTLRQAIQNTLDTGMDRYIREAIND